MFYQPTRPGNNDSIEVSWPDWGVPKRLVNVLFLRSLREKRGKECSGADYTIDALL